MEIPGGRDSDGFCSTTGLGAQSRRRHGRAGLLPILTIVTGTVFFIPLERLVSFPAPTPLSVPSRLTCAGFLVQPSTVREHLGCLTSRPSRSTGGLWQAPLGPPREFLFPFSAGVQLLVYLHSKRAGCIWSSLLPISLGWSVMMYCLGLTKRVLELLPESQFHSHCV